jgi:hypothetical protein
MADASCPFRRARQREVHVVVAPGGVAGEVGLRDAGIEAPAGGTM